MIEFIVARIDSEGSVTSYCESIDSYDGDTEWTSVREHARIFHGQEWMDYWTSPEYRILEIEQ